MVTYAEAWKHDQELQGQVLKAYENYAAAVTIRDSVPVDSPHRPPLDARAEECRGQLLAATDAVVQNRWEHVQQGRPEFAEGLEQGVAPDRSAAETAKAALEIAQQQLIEAGVKEMLEKAVSAKVDVLLPPDAQQMIATIKENKDAYIAYGTGLIKETLGIEPAQKEEPAKPFDHDLARAKFDVEDAQKRLEIARDQEAAFQKLDANTQALGRGHTHPEVIEKQLKEAQEQLEKTAERNPEVKEARDKVTEEANQKSLEVIENAKKIEESRNLTPDQKSMLEERKAAELAKIEMERKAEAEAAVQRELERQAQERARQIEDDRIR